MAMYGLKPTEVMIAKPMSVGVIEWFLLVKRPGDAWRVLFSSANHSHLELRYAQERVNAAFEFVNAIKAKMDQSGKHYQSIEAGFADLRDATMAAVEAINEYETIFERLRYKSPEEKYHAEQERLEEQRVREVQQHESELDE